MTSFSLSLVIGVVALTAGLLIGRALGVRATMRAARSRLSAFANALRTRRSSTTTPATFSEEFADLEAVLEAEWVRKGSEREEAVQAALERLSAFLKVAVEAPLNRALAAGGDYREGVEDALGAIEDLEFFLEDPPEGSGRAEVRAVTRRVIREFVESWGTKVRELFPERPIHVRMNSDAFMDALFLILHNAAQFGTGDRITVEVREAGNDVQVSVRDTGPGFSAEALLRAMDPFYSTSAGGLGMGLPQARRLLERQGGSITFRNHDEGGAEVVVSFPVD